MWGKWSQMSRLRFSMELLSNSSAFRSIPTSMVRIELLCSSMSMITSGWITSFAFANRRGHINRSRKPSELRQRMADLVPREEPATLLPVSQSDEVSTIPEEEEGLCEA